MSGSGQLPRKWVLMDRKGRITIPAYMRRALGVPEDAENYPLLIEAYPSLEECKALFLKRGL